MAPVPGRAVTSATRERTVPGFGRDGPGAGEWHAVQVAAAAVDRPTGGAVAVVLRDLRTGRHGVIARRQSAEDGVPGLYRAMLLGLWAARRRRARAVVLLVADPDVAAHLGSTAVSRAGSTAAPGVTPPPVAPVACLQVRALLNAFAQAEVRVAPRTQPDLARAAAAAEAMLRPRAERWGDLPLWSSARAAS